VREVVDAILVEQQRAWVRGAIFAGHMSAPSAAPPSTAQIIVHRGGAALLTITPGTAIGVIGGEAPAGVVVGLVLGSILGLLHRPPADR
jgi:hypothetical protein